MSILTLALGYIFVCWIVARFLKFLWWLVFGKR